MSLRFQTENSPAVKKIVNLKRKLTQ